MGIPVGSGLATQVVAKDEVTYGVAPDLTTGVDSYEIKSDTLELKKTAVTSEGLSAGKLYLRTKRRVVTNYDVTGALHMDAPTRNLAFWLRYMVGSFGQTLAAPTEVGATGIYKSVHQPGAMAGYSFSLQKGVPATDATVEPFTYVGCKIPSWELSVATGGLASLVLNMDARNELAGAGNGDPLNASVPALSPFAMPTTGLGSSVFHFRQATLYSGGTPTLASGEVTLTGATALGQVKSANIKHDFKYDTNRIFLGSSGFKDEQIEDGFRGISGSFVIEWQSTEAIYDAYAADTTTSLQLSFVGDAVSTSNYLLDIIVPNIKLEGESPKVPGPAVITQSANFTGMDDETTTPIQLTYQSEDATV